MRREGAGGELVEKTFHFEDDEYITHIGTAYAGSLDRIEFVTNKERQFTCGGPGGRYEPFTFNCLDSMHPRVIAFGIGLGPYDAHQLRAYYFDVSGDSPCRDISLEQDMQRRVEEADRQLR